MDRKERDDLPLISLVIPIYKVEDFLRECIDSAINQTYKNIEIMLIDDGSPDNCGKICDEYALKDNRIKVIHKENQGLSQARNDGIDKSSGEYICFIDSDDYLHPEYVERLYDIIHKYKCDFSFCCFYQVDESSNIVELKKNSAIIRSTEDELVYSKFEYLNIINAHKGSNMVWKNMFKRNIFDNIRFDYGKYWEDCRMMYKVIDLFDTIHGTGRQLYYYRVRETSFLNRKFNKTFLEFFEMLQDKLNYYLERSYETCAIDTINVFINRIYIYDAILYRNKKDNKQLIDEISSFCDYIIPYYNKYKENYSLSFRLKFFIYRHFPDLFIGAKHIFNAIQEKFW